MINMDTWVNEMYNDITKNVNKGGEQGSEIKLSENDINSIANKVIEKLQDDEVSTSKPNNKNDNKDKPKDENDNEEDEIILD